MNDQTDQSCRHCESELLSSESVKVIYSEHIRQESKVVPTKSQAETLSEIQGLFTDSQKIAYVGLCYTLIYNYKKNRFPSILSDKRASVQYEKWSLEYMEKIFVYLQFTDKERNLIQNLAFHGAQPQDLASTLIQDAKDIISLVESEEKARIRQHQEALDSGLMVPNDALFIPDRPRDIRFVVLSHMFLLSISDGFYDARSRALVKLIASHLEISIIDTIKVEFAIAAQLRISVHEGENLKHAETVVGERNKIETRNRYLFAGLATLAGGAVIGLTAGIAAPFIGAGIGATLSSMGVAGAAGVSTFMASAGGLALITTGGVLTGGGMSGVKMMKRTRGVQEFEFLSIEDAMELILQHREERRLERMKDSNISLDKKTDSRKDSLTTSSEKVTLNPKADKDDRGTEYVNPIDKNTAIWIENVHSLSLRSMDSILNSSSAFSISGGNLVDSSAANSTMIGSMIVHDAESDITSHSFVYANPAAQDSASRQTNVLITIAGWVYHSADEHSLPFSILEQNIYGDQYTLIWETDTLMELGTSLKILVSEIASFIVQQGIQALLLPALMAALTGPMWMLKLSYLIDNPFGNGLTKADKVGRVLADTLIGQVQGNRPVTLVGYSLGARVIYYCLEELAAKGAFGIVEDVYLLGCPVLVELKQWQNVATVVSGRIVNGYCSNDSILAIIYRASASSWSHVAGLQPILGVEGVENVNLEEIITGHTEYYSKLPLVLEKCGFSITDIYFEDEEDMQEQERIQVKEHKQKISEQKLREKEEKLKKRRQKYQEKVLLAQEEVDRQLAQKLKEEALKMVEQDSSSKGDMDAPKPFTQKSDNTIPEVDVPFEPKEIKSTLPPLTIIIQKKIHASPKNERHTRGDSIDLDSSLNEAGLRSLVENLDSGSAKSINAGLGITTEEIGQRRTEFEYISDTEDDAKTPKEATPDSLSRRESKKSGFTLHRSNSSPITEPSPTYTRQRRQSPLPRDLPHSFD